MKTLTTLVLSALLTVGCSMTGQVQADDDYFTQAELDSMLAPVALYPDSVLSHVLIAATYPLEVIQAARWSRERPGLRGEDAVVAVEYQNWDPSVKALVAFPELLERMDEDLQWTQRLGDAFLMQEEEVIASIQYLRSEAYSRGHLASNDRVKVVREKEYIYIEPARTRVVYVPYYDPRVVYSSWRWASHPPVYWHRPSGFNVSIGFHWGTPYYVRPDFYFSSFHWATRRVVVVNHHHHYYRDHGFHSGRDVARFEQARHWKHDPTHRRGVSYRGRVEQTRFVDNSRPASATVSSSGNRAVVRSERRDWAAERRSNVQFDRKAQSATRSSSRSSSRSDRVAELRDSGRSDSRAVTRSASDGGRDARIASRGSDRASVASDRGRTISGSAPARSEARSRASASDDARSSSGRSARVSESLRSGSTSRSSASASRAGSSSSRSAITSRSRGQEPSSDVSRSRSYSSSAADRGRSSSQRSVSVPRDLSVRQGSARERQSAPSRSRSGYSSAPSRGASIERHSAPSRSRPSVRESAPARSTPRVQSSAPSRSSEPAPSRSSRGTSARSSHGSAPSRSRGGDSRRGGGEERR